MNKVANRVLTALLAVVITVVFSYAASAETVLFQDFESPSGWRGDNPPPGWSIYDDGVADGIWDSFDWSRYFSWGGYTARVSGFSANRYNDDWLISPAVDFTSATACTLFFRHYYDDYLTQPADSALVLLSDDGGASWGDTVVTYSGADFGGDAVPDSEFFDISLFAAGENDIMVAFQYAKRTAVLVGSWKIDDIKFRADGGLLMHQDFESTWDGGNPPAGWAIDDINVFRWDENDWHQANASAWGNVAYVNWSPIEQQNEFLTSSAIDIADSANDVVLSFKHWYDDQTGNTDSAFVLGSIDGGLSWPETLIVFENQDRGSLSSPAYDTVNIFSWANGLTDARIGFKYVGNNDGRWYVDSVRVERIDMFQSDARVVEIVSPPPTIIPDYAWPVSAIVENCGLYPATFITTFTIYDSAGGLEQTNAVQSNNLQSLERDTLMFNSWTPASPGPYNLVCSTSLVSDMDHSNDTIPGVTYAYPHSGYGGPVEGWSFRDNISGGGSEFDWIDISASGTPIGFADPDDGNSGMIDLGIEFTFFGISYDRVAVSVDGWLSFIDSTTTDNTRSNIPDVDGPPGMIALLWQDLRIGSGHIYYLHDPDDSLFIVQYDNVEFASDPNSIVDMEIIFDGPDNTIIMQYAYFSGGIETDVTIGLENQAEDAGVAYSNAEIGQMPLPGLAVSFIFLPPHDVKPESIDQPAILIHDEQTYDIVARFVNCGANTETFDVTATASWGYSNTQTVTGLASLDTATVVFPAWSVTHECYDYALAIASGLAGDLRPENDTLVIALESTYPVNIPKVYDDGSRYAGITGSVASDVIASMFDTYFQNVSLSAATFKFLGADDGYPDPEPDSIIAQVFIDADRDWNPDIDPIFSRRIEVAQSGWTIWKIGCDTTITLDCSPVWIGWSIIEGLVEYGAVDRTLEYPDKKWAREEGNWHLLDQPAFYGDYMIRGYFAGDTTSSAVIALGTTQINGAAPPDGADTVQTFIQNQGTGCDLVYKVRVQQSVRRMELNRGAAGIVDDDFPVAMGPERIARLGTVHSDGLPGILGEGGPDNFGYTWIDSEEPGGPAYNWVDISSVGTETVWSYGDSDDGYTDPVYMGMTFNFYGANYDSIIISTNGWASFLRTHEIFAWSENHALPMPSEISALLAVDWDNLDGGTAGHCYYYRDVAANSFIVSWVDWSHVPAPTNQHSFQVILNGLDGSILYQYGPGTYQDDITIGIENENGDDGLTVAFNQPYVHSSLAVLFSPPIFWLLTDLSSGVLPAGNEPFPFNIYMIARNLPTGIYNGAIIIASTDVNEPLSVIDVQFEIEGICAYIPGDVNGSGNANGIDITFMVAFFKGGSAPHEECPPCAELGPLMLYPQGDVNGTCSWSGIDVSYFVNYLKGIGPPLRFCDQCPPASIMGHLPSARGAIH